jgi:hypothetical protein
MNKVIEITNWTHDPKRRKARFRCQQCSCLIEDGSNVVIEIRRPGGAHGYHKEHFIGLFKEAALARASGQ